MARQFSYPEVQALEVDGYVRIGGTPSAIRRKVYQYAKRAGRNYGVRWPIGADFADVTRLPDPVTDTELPGVG